MTLEYRLTTSDNPFDPFKQFDSWYMFDTLQGYNSSAYVARIAHTSEQLSEEENNEEIERAIDEILLYDFRGIYRKVARTELTNQ